MVITDLVPQACLFSGGEKTCGDDGLMPEMILTTAVADCNRPCIINMEGHPPGRVFDVIWDLFRIRLLSKCEAPALFKLLRPLKVSTKLWSKCCFSILENYDTVRSPAHMDFKKSFACAESPRWI